MFGGVRRRAGYDNVVAPCLPVTSACSRRYYICLNLCMGTVTLSCPKGRRVCDWLYSVPTLGGMLDFYTVGYAEAVCKAYGPVLRGVIVRRSDRTAYEETDTCIKHPKI